MIDARLRKAWRFFHEHAGWCEPPGKAACALSLAKAEQWASWEGVCFTWLPDALPWEGDCTEPEEVWGCVATLGDENASLWGIGDPSEEYRRVVEAELASELQEGFFEALGKHLHKLWSKA